MISLIVMVRMNVEVPIRQNVFDVLSRPIEHFSILTILMTKINMDIWEVWMICVVISMIIIKMKLEQN